MIGLQKGLAGPKCKGQNIKKEKVKSFSSSTFFSKDNNARLKFKGTEYWDCHWDVWGESGLLDDQISRKSC